MNEPSRNPLEQNQPATSAENPRFATPAAYVWYVRVLMISPTFIILSLGCGHDFLEKHSSWCRMHTLDEQILVSLMFLGVVTAGIMETKLRNTIYGITRSRTWLERIGDVLAFLLLQLLLMPVLLVLITFVFFILGALLPH